MDIAAWLQGLGLERYLEAFRANDVDADVLRGLTADDLKELGVVSLGHRKKLLEAIAGPGGAGSRAGARRPGRGRGGRQRRRRRRARPSGVS